MCDFLRSAVPTQHETADLTPLIDETLLPMHRSWTIHIRCKWGPTKSGRLVALPARRGSLSHKASRRLFNPPLGAACLFKPTSSIASLHLHCRHHQLDLCRRYYCLMARFSLDIAMSVLESPDHHSSNSAHASPSCVFPNPWALSVFMEQEERPEAESATIWCPIWKTCGRATSRPPASHTTLTRSRTLV